MSPLRIALVVLALVILIFGTEHIAITFGLLAVQGALATLYIKRYGFVYKPLNPWLAAGGSMLFGFSYIVGVLIAPLESVSLAASIIGIGLLFAGAVAWVVEWEV